MISHKFGYQKDSDPKSDGNRLARLMKLFICEKESSTVLIVGQNWSVKYSAFIYF